MSRITLALCALALMTISAEARPKQQTIIICTDRICESSQPLSPTTQAVRRVAVAIVDTGSAILGGRPSGCPHRFCGCALSLKLFGKQVAGLNLAINWSRFPRAAPAPGMVAVRRGHVFQLEAHVGGNQWRVWDPNSGGGKIRRHTRSIAGLTIVNPGAVQVASLPDK